MGALHNNKGINLSSTYSVAITGLKAGIARETAIKQLADLLKVTKEKVVSILDSQKFAVKSGVDLATAAKYETAIRSCGGSCIVEPDVTETEDLIFDIPESLSLGNGNAKELPPKNQDQLPQIQANPAVIRAVTFYSVLILLSVVCIFIAFYVAINSGIGSFFTGGKNVALASGIIQQSLKSPSSFSLVSGKEMWEGQNSEGKSAHIVEIEYDAQNGFGASLRDCKVLAFYTDGDSVMWSSLWGAMPCASNPAHGGLLEHSKVVEIIREKNSFK